MGGHAALKVNDADLAALDEVYAEAQVVFGPDPNAGCPAARDMLARMAPPMPDLDAARLAGMSYSKLMHGLKQAGIDINRKMLADLAVRDASAFQQLVQQATAR